MHQKFIIDSHVHLYPHFDVAEFLETAHRRLSYAATAIGEDDATLVLMLTETAQDNAFTKLKDRTSDLDSWQADQFTSDPTAVRLHDSTRSIVVIAGRQIVTREKIEVLALGTTETYKDGQPISDVLSHLQATRTPVVIPWGVGKWIGARGKRVAAILAASGRNSGLLLGDNAGRPVGSLASAIFRKAVRTGVPILPGSDPLPIVGAEKDVGGYCFLLTGEADPASPGASIKKLLLEMRGQPKTAGSRKNVVSVFRDQIRLRRNRQN